MKEIKNLEVYEVMLIIVDMVNGFVKEGVLADKTIGDVVPRQIELIKKAKEEGKLIMFIKDTHDENSTEHKRFPDKHCVKGSGEEKVIDEIKPFEEWGVSIEKNSTSFMEAPDFRKLVEQAKNIKKVDVVGCCTDICVVNGTIGLANYFDQWNRDVEIKVHKDAIATYAEDVRQNYVDAAILLMEQQGIKIVGEKKLVKTK